MDDTKMIILRERIFEKNIEKLKRKLQDDKKYEL
jgi:hypothetical protein